MGVQDRSYMRSRPVFGGGGSWTVRLLLVMGGVYVLQQLLRPHVGDWLQLSWPGLIGGRIWTPLTAAFVHSESDVWHLVFNLLGLFWFGRLVEDVLGPRGFLRFALVAAVAAHVPYLAWQAVSGDGVPTVGASGIVMACLAMAALRFPRQRFLIFPIPVAVPLWLLAVVYVGLDLAKVGGQVHGGAMTNHLAHLGGAAFGVLIHFRGGVPWPSWLRMPRRGPGRREPPDGDRLVRHGPDERARVDELLDKIAREGIASLSAEEREFLNSASRRYR